MTEVLLQHWVKLSLDHNTHCCLWHLVCRWFIGAFCPVVLRTSDMEVYA